MTQNRRGQWHVIAASGSAGIAERPTTAGALERKKIGRPTDYTPEIAREIADRMIDGNSLRAVCQQDDMPDEGTVYRWIARHPEFREVYASAGFVERNEYQRG